MIPNNNLIQLKNKYNHFNNYSKILSNSYSINFKKNYSTNFNKTELGPYLAGLIEGDGSIETLKFKEKVTKFSPYWITGFSDAESSFIVSIFKSIDRKIGWRVKPAFSILLHFKDIDLLYKIQSFFSENIKDRKVGLIIKNTNEKKVQFTGNSFSDLKNIIIPHFIQYPLFTQKRADFILFNLILDLIEKGEDKNIEG